jgi:hypothetical protein
MLKQSSSLRAVAPDIGLGIRRADERHASSRGIEEEFLDYLATGCGAQGASTAVAAKLVPPTKSERRLNKGSSGLDIFGLPDQP